MRRSKVLKFNEQLNIIGQALNMSYNEAAASPNNPRGQWYKTGPAARWAAKELITPTINTLASYMQH